MENTLFRSGCKLFVEKFVQGLAKTSGSNFGQENGNWEPRFNNEKLGNFAASETRLVEILDGNFLVCVYLFPFSRNEATLLRCYICLSVD